MIELKYFGHSTFLMRVNGKQILFDPFITPNPLATVFDFGKVKYVNAIHSSTLPEGSGGANPGGFVITSEEGLLYYAGNTALTYDMKLIGESITL